MDQRSPVTRYSQGALVCTTSALAYGPLCGAVKTPLGLDQVNVLLLLSGLLDSMPSQAFQEERCIDKFCNLLRRFVGSGLGDLRDITELDMEQWRSPRRFMEAQCGLRS
jgi:hypothetical protein